MTETQKHIGCIGEGCPICQVIDKPGYEVNRAYLMGQPAAVAPYGPGTELKKMLAALGLPTCGECAKLSAQMDAWGIAGCRQRRTEIATALRTRMNQLGERLKPAALAAALGMIEAYIEEAISRAVVGVPISVNQGAGGLGDALTGSCAILGLHRKYPDRRIIYKTHPHTHGFLRLFNLPSVTLGNHNIDDLSTNRPFHPKSGDLQMNPGYGNELRSKGARSRLERNCANIGGVTPELPKLRDPGALRALDREYRGAVVLSPFSTWPVREYHIKSWLTVERLLREEGYRVLVLDATNSDYPNRHAPLRSEIILNAPADRVTGILLNAAAVVGNDSGIAHLAGMIGAKTLVLLGQTSGPPIFGYYDQHHGNMTYLDGHLDCKGCWWQPQHGFTKPKCEPTCPNLASITPEEVVAAVKEMAGEPQAPPRGETCKAHARRLREGWYAEHIKAPCLDVGCWVDFLRPGFRCTRWDQMYGDGDATILAGVKDESYQTVYCSHVLEHVRDPIAALRSWWRVLKPGGKLVVCVPHRDLYEGKLDLPSRWNGDHKSFWLPDTKRQGHLWGLRQAIAEAIPGGEVVSFRVLDEGHYYPDSLVHPLGEFSIEAIVRKQA